VTGETEKTAGDDERRDQRKRRGPRPRGAVRSALIAAGVELARSGGPDAVVLREVTRMVGVVPNAAYRHFADREALLAAIRDEAVGELSRRMAEGMGQVRAGRHTPMGARLRLRAIGRGYLDFARTEPGLFDIALTGGDHGGGAAPEPQPLDLVKAALDDLVEAGVLDPGRRADIEYPTWATVHGFAVLLRGPLSSLPDREKARLEAQTLAFIGEAVS